MQVAVQAFVVVPVDPTEGGELDVLDGLPGSSLTGGAADQFGLVVAVHGLGQSVVVRISDGADRGHRADLSEPFAVSNRRELGLYDLEGLLVAGGGRYGGRGRRLRVVPVFG